jgi:alkylated DNA repair dioxygenase AlkB
MTAPPITYIPGFVSEPNKVLERLQKELDWERRADAPRSEYYCNDFTEPYTYGNGTGRRTYYPRPYHPEVLAIRQKLEEVCGCKFEVCFLNRYMNQSDHLGWHADASPEMDDARPIATVSLGVEREIWFRPNGPENTQNITKIKLENGSCCLMLPGMQDTHQHRIPKASFQCGERISLTFRGYVKGVANGSVV